MLVAAIVTLAVGTYALRVAGPALGRRLRLPGPAQRMLPTVVAVLLLALAATAALTQGHGFAGWARPAGVLAGGVLAVRRAPLPAVVIAAAATTAALRWLGVA